MKSLFFITYFSYFLPYTLMIPWLSSQGFSPEQRSLMFAVSAVMTMLGQFLSGFLCDRLNTVRRLFIITLSTLIGCGWLLYRVDSGIGALVWAALFGSAFRINMGILDSWALESEKTGRSQYGLIRGCGALGSIAGSVFASILAERRGMHEIASLIPVVGAAALILACRQKEGRSVHVTSAVCWNDVKQLLKQDGYLRMVIILFIINFMANADLLTVIDKMTALGANSRLISIKWALQSCCELPLFLVSGWLLERWNARSLLQFSLVMYALRLLLTGLTTSPGWIVIISGLQLVTFPLFQIASKILISQQVPDSLRATGQQFALGIYSGCSMAVSPLILGGLTAVFSYDITLVITALIGVIPAVLLGADKRRPSGAKS